MASRQCDLVKDGRQVIGAHLLPVEVPVVRSLVVLVGVGVQSNVLTGVSVSARVANPHVVASIGDLEGRSNLRLVNDPTISAVEDAVLQEYWRLGAVRSLTNSSGDTPHSQNVVVFSGHGMRFGLEAIFRTDFLKGLFTIGRSSGGNGSRKNRTSE
jgi:hypothetical protein